MLTCSVSIGRFSSLPVGASRRIEKLHTPGNMVKSWPPQRATRCVEIDILTYRAMWTATEVEQFAWAMDQAANDIEKYGWRRGGCLSSERDSQGTYSRCLWVAGMRALGRTSEISISVKFLDVFEHVLSAKLGVRFARDIFAVNDTFPGSDEEGKVWAAATLREIAQKFHGASARTSGAGMVTAGIR